MAGRTGLEAGAAALRSGWQVNTGERHMFAMRGPFGQGCCSSGSGRLERRAGCLARRLALGLGIMVVVVCLAYCCGAHVARDIPHG